MIITQEDGNGEDEKNKRKGGREREKSRRRKIRTIRRGRSTRKRIEE